MFCSVSTHNLWRHNRYFIAYVSEQYDAIDYSICTIFYFNSGIPPHDAPNCFARIKQNERLITINIVLFLDCFYYFFFLLLNIFSCWPINHKQKEKLASARSWWASCLEVLLEGVMETNTPQPAKETKRLRSSFSWNQFEIEGKLNLASR